MQPGDKFESDELINVSALNQYTYCPRRCGLIYLENEFSDNIHTLRGNAEHERVDQTGYVTTREGARTEYALPIWSERLGLIGKCDVVEFWPDGNIYPVEYKHGVRKKRLNDDLQLVTQALCLEEMTDKVITHGATRQESIARMRCALDEFIIGGIRTNIPLHQALLVNQEVVTGRMSTRTIERVVASGF